MDLSHLIESLSRPSAYPHPVDAVEIHQTHISVVFLAGPFAYKIKKPVNLGFLDFTTLERRRDFCEREVRLNRRLAPDVYLDVVPVCGTADGIQLEGQGGVVEYAVKMKRLPESATLEGRIAEKTLDASLVRAVARKVASFHASAESSDAISQFGTWDVVARNLRENFEQAAPFIGVTLSQRVFDRLQSLSEDALSRLRPLIELRARSGMIRDTHGDLRLEHVYYFPDRAANETLSIIDCIEFNDRFRYADPIADMAFLVMDLQSHGRRDLAEVLAEEYFQASGDTNGRELLPLYVSYRAAVRGKVEGFQLSELEIPAPERNAAQTRARAHWLLALEQLESPRLRPCLVLVGGLPGTGKSTLAADLSERGNFRLIRSDVVRKQLAGIPTHESARAAFNEGIYSREWTDRTYAECLRLAEESLFEGARVVVDASFGSAHMREAFFEAARRWGVPVRFLVCQTSPATARQRIAARRNDVSDADWEVYRNAALRWEATSENEPVVNVSTEGTVAHSVEVAAKALGPMMS